MNSKLIVNFCSHDAVDYACKNWHYSKCLPTGKLVKIGVWEDEKFIGCIIYSRGASPFLFTKYNLSQYEGCELTRVAMREHKYPVSQMLGISLTLLKKHCPGLKLVVSFADPKEGHLGIIYQATNWIYTGNSKSTYTYRLPSTGKIYHVRNVFDKRHKINGVIHTDHYEKIYNPPKYRYLMPLDKKTRKWVEKLRKPYPKNTNAAEVSDGYHPDNTAGV